MAVAACRRIGFLMRYHADALKTEDSVASLAFFDHRAAPRVLAALAFGLAAAGASAQAPLKTTTLRIGTHAIKAEVADTDESRTRGLMFRQSLGRNDGMLFIFTEMAYHSMWMMNTYVPLSVAFLDAEGRILNVEDMEPKTQDTHSAAGPARYALEMNRGWFAERKIKAGDRVAGLPAVKGDQTPSSR